MCSIEQALFSEKNCTVDYPFAYLNGDYCCKTNQELWYGGNPEEVASGTCDGTGFSKESTCCKGHDYLKCPNLEGCEDFNGGKKLDLIFLYWLSSPGLK